MAVINVLYIQEPIFAFAVQSKNGNAVWSGGPSDLFNCTHIPGPQGPFF